jgi:RHS repeat-associated protein
MPHIPSSEDNVGIMYYIHPLAERHINREAWPCLSIYGLKSNIPEYIIKNNEKYKIISNHLGSPIEIAEASMGALPVLQIKYDSFGNVIEETGNFDLLFGFAGGLWDKDTKLTRFGVRDYDSETGRWTSKEPLGFDGARNFYVYAGNDGVMLWDLTGLKPGDCFSTPDAAAIDALNYIYGESNLIQKEMGGVIYKKNDKCYYASKPIIGEFDSIYFPPSLLVNAVSDYHSHVDLEGEMYFSNEDIFNNVYEHINGYLINQEGEILRFEYKSNEVINLYSKKFIFNGIDDSNIMEYYQWLIKD